MKYPYNTHNRARLEKHWPDDPANGDDDDWPDDEQEPDYASDEAERKAAALDCPEVRAIERHGVTY